MLILPGTSSAMRPVRSSQVRDLERLPAALVHVGERAVLHADARDVELDLRGLRRRCRRRLRARGPEQVLEVELAALGADHARLQARDAAPGRPATSPRSSGSSRTETCADVERGEIMRARAPRQRHLAHRDAERGPEGELHVAVELQRAARVLLHQRLHLVLVLIRIESERQDRRAGDEQHHQREQAVERILEPFHAGFLPAMPNGTWPVATCLPADSTWPRWSSK